MACLFGSACFFKLRLHVTLLISELLCVFNNDASYELEQGFMGLIRIRPREASMALVRWGVPAEMGHAILPGALCIVPLPNILRAALPSLHTDAFRRLLGLVLQSVAGEDFDGSAFAAHGFAPAEVLHGVRPPLVVVRGFSSGVSEHGWIRRQSR